MKLPYFSGSSDVDYAYAYGRVSGMQGQFISVRELENYATSVSVDEVVASLENTTYGADITKAVFTPKNISEVERALNNNRARVYSEVLEMIPEKDARQLDKLLTGVWHHSNLKLILRCIHAGAPTGDIKSDFKPNTGFDYLPLLDAAGVDEFAPQLGEPYKSRLEAAGVLDKTGADLGLIESLMDAALVDSWQETLEKPELSEYAGVVADTTNLLALARCVKAGVDPAGYLAKAGRQLGESRLNELSKMSIEGLAEALKKTPYARAFTDGVKALGESGSLLTLERELLDYLEEYVEAKAILEPLSIYSVLAFISKKQSEVDNLRKIIILKSHEIPAEKIRGVLRLS